MESPRFQIMESSTLQPTKPFAMPVMCYICGREFGSRSIQIHIPQCIKKFEAEQNKLPRKQRRPLPQPPADYDKIVSGEIKGKELQSKLEQYNDQAFDQFNKKALIECEHCGRTFLPRPLEIHQKSCTKDHPAERSHTAKEREKALKNNPLANPKARSDTSGEPLRKSKESVFSHGTVVSRRTNEVVKKKPWENKKPAVPPLKASGNHNQSSGPNLGSTSNSKWCGSHVSGSHRPESHVSGSHRSESHVSGSHQPKSQVSGSHRPETHRPGSHVPGTQPKVHHGAHPGGTQTLHHKDLFGSGKTYCISKSSLNQGASNGASKYPTSRQHSYIETPTKGTLLSTATLNRMAKTNRAHGVSSRQTDSPVCPTIPSYAKSSQQKPLLKSSIRESQPYRPPPVQGPPSKATSLQASPSKSRNLARPPRRVGGTSPSPRPGTYTKANHIELENGQENPDFPTREDLMAMVEKDVAFSSPQKRKKLWEFIKKLTVID